MTYVFLTENRWSSIKDLFECTVLPRVLPQEHPVGLPLPTFQPNRLRIDEIAIKTIYPFGISMFY